MSPQVVVVHKSYRCDKHSVTRNLVPPTTIWCDNSSAINLSKNHVMHSRTKHVDVRNYFLRDHIDKKDISFEYVDTTRQLTDILPKPLKKRNSALFDGSWGLYYYLITNIIFGYTHICFTPHFILALVFFSCVAKYLVCVYLIYFVTHFLCKM